MENNVYNGKRSNLVSLMETVIQAAYDKGKAGETFTQPSSLACDLVNMVERLAWAQQRDELRGKLVLDPKEVPAAVMDDYLYWESKFRSENEGEAQPVEMFSIIEDLTRATIRHDLKAAGYKVWGAVNGHELYGMEGESSAYAQHSDACGCMWLSPGDEPWEPMGDW